MSSRERTGRTIVPVPNDPTQRIDEFITRMRHFKEVKRLLKLLDPGILAYVWTDQTPDDEGPHLVPPVKYDSLADRFFYPVKEELDKGTLLSLNTRFLNDGANAGNHSTILTPTEGSTMEVIWASVQNADTVNRNLAIGILTAGGTLARPLVASVSTAAAASIHYPAVLDTGHSRVPVESLQRFQMDALAVGVSQDSNHFVVYRYFGDTAPTISQTGPTNCTIAGIP